MNKKIVIFIGLILVAVVVVVLSLGLSKNSDNPQTNEATPAAATAEVDSSALGCIVYDKNGNKVNISDFKGKPMVINFWTSWCEPCKEEMPNYQKAFKKYGSQVQFLMIDATGDPGETVEEAAAVIEKGGYTFPVFYDKDENAAKEYNLTSLPTTLFIDKYGNVALESGGAATYDELEQGINFILEQ